MLRPLARTLLAALVLAPVAAAAQAPIKIAVLPVVVHTMDERTYLQEGMADMLASRLGQHRGVGVILVAGAAQLTGKAAIIAKEEGLGLHGGPLQAKLAAAEGVVAVDAEPLGHGTAGEVGFVFEYSADHRRYHRLVVGIEVDK